MARTFALLLTLALAFPALAAQPDYAREKRWADEITPSLLVGDPVYLALKSGHKFLGIHAPSSKARAGVIIVHGAGLHPDWNLINVLRSRLAEQEYATLSIQMPVLAADANHSLYPPLFGEAAERLQVAAAFLRDRGHRRIAIVSHSLGSRMVNEFLLSGGTVDAWVSIGINTGVYDQPETIKIPVLDIFSDKDFTIVLQNAAKRAQAIKRVRGSMQIEVTGTDHFFNGAETELVRHVKRFLDHVTR